MADLFDRFGNRISVATTADLEGTDTNALADVEVTTPVDGEFLVYDEANSVWRNISVHDGVDLHDQTKEYAADDVVIKDDAVYIANDTIPADTEFAEGTEGATWRLVGATADATGGSAQPIVQTILNARDTTSLEVDDYNWFNVTPTGDVTLEFSLTRQDEGRFDLVWENAARVLSESLYALDTATYDNTSFSVTSQETSPFGLEFSDDGTKMYVIGFNSASIHQYTLSTAFDVSTASYDSVNLSVSGEDSLPIGMTIDNVGTKLYMVGFNTHSVYQYSMSTPYDLSTATYDTVSFDMSAQGNNPVGVAFNLNGTKMYMASSANETVFQYTLDTAYDVGTATYDGVSFDASTQDGDITDILFSNDGSKFFVTGNNTNTIYRYSLSTPFDLSTISYDNISFDASTQDGGLTSAVFNSEGTKMFLLGSDNDSVYQYTAGEVVTGGQATLTFPASVEWASGAEPTLSGLGEEDWFRFETKDRGATWYAEVVGESASGGGGAVQPVVQDITDADGATTLDADVHNWFNVTPVGDVTLDFDLSSQEEGRFDLVWENVELGATAVGYDLENTSYDNVSFSVSGQDTSPTGVAFNNDGTKMYTLGNDTDSVHQYTLSTAFDVSTASYDNVSFDVSGQSIIPRDIAFNNDGTKMYILGNDTDSVHQYTLSTGFDLSTVSYDNVNFSLAGQDTVPLGFAFNTDGTRMYMIGVATDSVYQYTLNTGFDLSTASYDNASFDASGQDGNPLDVTFNDDGTRMYILGNDTDSVHQYTLSAAFDLSTASYDNISFDVSGQDTSPFGITFSDDGTKMYMVGNGNDSIYQYTTGEVIPGQPATLDFPASVEWSSGTSPTLSAVGEEDWFRFETKDGGTTWYGEVLGEAAGAETYIQPTVASITDAAGTTTLDADVHNWFNVKPVDDVSLAFALNDQSEGRFDLVWENVELGATTVGYDLENTSYDNVSFDTTGQVSAGAAYGLDFSNDGTKMFVSDLENVYQYSLSTPYDVGSSVYNGVFLDVSAQENITLGVTISDGGTKLYVVGTQRESVQQYTLGTAFDLSTASYDSVSFDVSAQDTAPIGIAFNTDGTKMYMVGNVTDSVYQYSLSTAFDLSTASYDNVSFSLAGQDTSPQDITFNSDGTKMFVGGTSDSIIRQYSLSTAFDLSTASYDNVTFDVSAQAGTVRALVFGDDGGKLYFVTNTDSTVYQYTAGETIPGQPANLDFPASVEWTTGVEPGLSAPEEKDWFRFETYDGGTTWFGTPVYQEGVGEFEGGSSAQPSVLVKGDASGTETLALKAYNYFDFTPAGNVTLSPDLGGRSIGEFDLVWFNGLTNLTGYVVNTTTLGGVDGVPYNVAFNEGSDFLGDIYMRDDGRKMYIAEYDGDGANPGGSLIWEYDLSSAYDLSTATAVRNFDYATIAGMGNVWGLYFKPDGTKMYIGEYGGNLIAELDLSTPWDLTSASFVQSISAPENSLTIAFSPDGSNLYAATYGLNDLYQFSLSTPWDLSTATLTNQIDYFTISGSSGGENAAGIDIKNDGSQIYMTFYGVSTADDVVRVIDLSTPFDLSTASHNSDVQLAGQRLADAGISFANDGQYMFSVSYGNVAAYRWATFSGGDEATLTFQPNVTWESGSAPTLSSTNQSDWFQFKTVNGGAKWIGKVIDQGF